LPAVYFRREALPWDAAFLAGKVFLRYRRGGGVRRSPLPDFYIGAHAAVLQYRLLTLRRPPLHDLLRQSRDHFSVAHLRSGREIQTPFRACVSEAVAARDEVMLAGDLEAPGDAARPSAQLRVAAFIARLVLPLPV
jgi:hypothetical protein